MPLASAATVLAADTAPASGDGQLIAAALLGIAVVVVLIAAAKVHPFLALILGTAVLGIVGGLGPSKTRESFVTGVGATVGSVGLLIALGSMIGALLADSGGADAIVDRVVHSVSGRALPWAMGGVAALIGLPLFFEVGVVLLVPVVLLVSHRTDVPLLKIGIPALAGLSVLHGLVPPHPGPLVAIAALHADLGITLAFGILVAIPTVIIAGPVYGSFISRYITAVAPTALFPEHEPVAVGAGGGREHTAASGGFPAGGDLVNPNESEPPATVRGAGRGRRRPSVWTAVLTILLPIIFMLLGALGELAVDEGSGLRKALDIIGQPIVALLAGTLVAMFALGYFAGFSREEVSASLGGSLPPIAGILLIVAAGGGFKQVLVDAGVGTMVGNFAKDASLSPLLLGWLVAVGIRLATGSATVATITAAGIVSPLAAGLDKPGVALLALAVGCGSLFFSHVNDAGFWLVKEYFGMSIGETIKSWSVMETIISVVGFIGVYILYLIF